MTKKLIKSVLSICLIIMLFTALTACFDGKQPGAAPDGDGIDIDVGADTITISRSTEDKEFSIDGQNWRDNPTFTGLTPNTEYIVYMRYKASGGWPASLAYTEKVTTLKHEQELLPEVSYIQADNVLTFTDETSAGVEFSYDNGATYTADKTHTYTAEGDYTVRVRYKETNEKYESEDITIALRVSKFYSGFGTAQDPYLIKTLTHFNYISANAYYKLIDDITFPDAPLTSLINSIGVFDGNGHALIKPKVNIINGNIAGVFARMGTVQNLTVQNAVINLTTNSSDNSYYVGIIAGVSQIISNCSVIDGEINVTNTRSSYAYAYIGGLAGQFNGGLSGRSGFSISNSSADVIINYTSVENTGNLYIGGLVGADYNGDALTVTESYAHIAVDAVKTQTGYIGGIAGSMKGSINNCYSRGSVATSGDSQGFESRVLKIGGIVGALSGGITNSYCAMNIGANGTSQNVRAGGIAGELTASTAQTVSNCFFAGNINITAGVSSTALSDSLASNMSGSYTAENNFHSDNLISPVSTGNTAAVSAATIMTATWQRDALKLDANIWIFSDGAYPTLKA